MSPHRSHAKPCHDSGVVVSYALHASPVKGEVPAVRLLPMAQSGGISSSEPDGRANVQSSCSDSKGGKKMACHLVDLPLPPRAVYWCHCLDKPLSLCFESSCMGHSLLNARLHSKNVKSMVSNLRCQGHTGIDAKVHWMLGIQCIHSAGPVSRSPLVRC